MADTSVVTVAFPTLASAPEPTELLNAQVSRQHEEFIAGQLPSWFIHAPEYLRSALRQSMAQWQKSQAEIAEVFARVTPIDTFAEPLLKAALSAYGWGHINPRTHGLKQVRLLSNPLLFMANQQIRLIDSLAHLLLPETLVPASLEINLVSSISQHDLLQAALQNFAGSETIEGGMATGSSIYACQNNEFIDLADFSPEMFARICSDLNIGEQYQWHLSRVFTPVENAYAATDPRAQAYKLKERFSLNKRFAFMAELHMAFMRGHLTLRNYNFILNSLLTSTLTWRNMHNTHSTFELMGFEVAGMIVLWPERRPATERQRCVVYLPQAPGQAFFEFSQFDQFKVELRQWLKQREFADYFIKLVPLRYRAEFIRRTDLKNVSWDSLLLLRSPIITEPALFKESRLVAQLGDPFEVAWLLQLEQIKDDARLLAVPTADEDSKERLERQAAFWNAGLSALTLVIGFVPVVGEVMLVFGVVQLATDIYEGIKAWQRDDKVAALEHLFDIAQNLAMVAVPGVAKSLKPSSVVDQLVQVTLANGQKRLWKPNLKPYACRPEVLAGLKPDALGLYHLRGRQYLKLDKEVYRVKGDLQTDQLSIDPLLEPQAYSPPLRHNGRGAWTHELEDPMQWSRIKLVRRLGPDTQLLSERTCEHILEMTGTTEGELRKLYIDNLPRPPLLEDCIKRVGLSEHVEHISTQMRQGLYRSADFAPMQLELLTHLPGWPQDRTLRVVDMQRGTFKDYGTDSIRAFSRVEVTQAQIEKGDLLKATLESLSVTQTETLLGRAVIGEEAQARKLARTLGQSAQTTKGTLVSRLYARDEALDPAMRNIRRKFPSLPANVLNELVSHLSPDELLALTYLGRLPLRALEEARHYAQRLRVNRALEGIYCEALRSPDSQTLAWHTLAQLAGWPKKARITVRNRSKSQLLSLIEGEAGQVSREIFKVGDQYESYDLKTGMTFTSPDVAACVFNLLTDSERSGFNTGAALSYSNFRSRIATLAAQQRDSSAQGLGMHKIKPGFTSPMRLADGRVGYTLGGRSGHLRNDSKALILKDLVLELYPNLSEAQAGQYLYRLQLTPTLAARELGRLKAEFEGLRKVLHKWEGAEIWTTPSVGPRSLVPAQTKREMSRALIRAWRRLSTGVSMEGRRGYELDLNGWPVDSLPPLEADFGHIISLYMTNISCAISASLLERFTELRDLTLTNTQLVELPTSIAKMLELTHLNLRNNRIVLTPESAAILSGMSKLKSLVLNGNPLGHDFTVAHMPDLQHLSLRHTALTDWPSGIEALHNLQTLDLRNNAISHIPIERLAPSMAAINRVTSLHDNPLSPDSIRRLALYREQELINFGMMELHQHAPRTQGINYWATEPTAEQSQLWSTLVREPEARDFFGLLDDLSTTSQFVNTKMPLTRRVWTLLQAVHDSTELRGRLFGLAGHLRTCSDGIAMVFAELELDYQVFLAEHAAHSEQAMLKLARGLFRIEVLNQHVLSIIKTRTHAIEAAQLEHLQELQTLIDTLRPDFATLPLAEMELVEVQGVAYRLGTDEGLRLAALLSPDSVQRQIARLDPMQIQMFYHVNLATELELPARPTSMRFDNIANVSAAELEAARQYVLAQEQMPTLVESIAGQEFWSDYLRKKSPDSFTEVLSKYQDLMDDVYSQRTTLSSDEYKRQSDNVGKERNNAIAQVVNLLTRLELQAHPLPALAIPGSSKSTDV